MSDYADLCEMYGREPSDPDFIDDLIADISSENMDSDYIWYKENEDKDHYQILQKHFTSIDSIVELDVSPEVQFSLLVMLHGHVISALEGYLAGKFIHVVTNSEELIRKLVETDPEFSKQKFSMKEIFEKKDSLKITVSTYLKNLIFHDLKKIKPMYKEVLAHDFGNISWLFKDVEIRHDCVHRAGYDKENNKVNISVDSIKGMLSKVKILTASVEDTMNLLREHS